VAAQLPLEWHLAPQFVTVSATRSKCTTCLSLHFWFRIIALLAYLISRKVE
jgi:hypothetical protein